MTERVERLATSRLTAVAVVGSDAANLRRELGPLTVAFCSQAAQRYEILPPVCVGDG